MGGSTAKVIRVIARLNVGGPATHVKTLCEGLGEFGFESILVSGAAGKNEAEIGVLFQEGKLAKAYKEIHLGELGRSLSFLGDMFSFFKLVMIFIREKPQIVHTHTAKAGVLGRLAAIVARVPIRVHTFHGHVLSGYFSAPVTKGFILIERILASFSTRLVTLSDGLVTELSQRFKLADPKKFKVIPLGRDLGEFQKTPRYLGIFRKELGFEHDDFVIGTLGRLVPIKNQAMMLKALAKVANKKIKLVIVGDGELKLDLVTLADKLGISGQVFFLGWRSNLSELYSDFDLTLMTSFNEGTPLSIIESFATGCPVVSTRVGGVDDLFTPLLSTSGETFPGDIYPSNNYKDVFERQEGWVLTTFDPSSLAELVLALFRDKGAEGKILLKKSAQCRTRSQHFSAKNLIQNMNDFYLELLKERSL